MSSGVVPYTRQLIFCLLKNFLLVARQKIATIRPFMFFFLFELTPTLTLTFGLVPARSVKSHAISMFILNSANLPSTLSNASKLMFVILWQAPVFTY